MIPSADGNSIFYMRFASPGIFRAGKSGLNEELVYKPEATTLWCSPQLLFPEGNDLLIATSSGLAGVNLSNHQAVDFGEISGASGWFGDIVWAEPGKSVLFTRTLNDLTNIWKYSLQDRSMTQITFGTGPDYSPMPDPDGKGLYYLNGNSSEILTTYHVQSRESTDIVSEDAGQPAISPDGKRVIYITHPASQKSDLWVSDINGGNKVKIFTGEDLGPGIWARDNFHLAFVDKGAHKTYIVGADTKGLRQVPPIKDADVATAVWSSDQKSLYLSTTEGLTAGLSSTWKWSLDGSTPEKIVDKCGMVVDADLGGEYLLGGIWNVEKAGIYEVSISDKKCILLLPGVAPTDLNFANDGNSFLYAVDSRGQIKTYRQPWRNGKLVGAPQVVLKLPFAIQTASHYNAYAFDFSRDLSTIVYARPGGHEDLYLLSQK